MSDMVERVSRGLARVAAERAMESDSAIFLRLWDGVDYYVSQNWTTYERDARAAIEAMPVTALVAALERLGSSEGLTGTFYIGNTLEGRELQARMTFARESLAALPPKGE